MARQENIGETLRKPILVPISKQVEECFIDYSMSVIIGRAIPDVRDGLKPVHRRILYGMMTGGYLSDRKTRKCAKICGDIVGKYHPHGDAAVYDSLVRLAQPFSLRYPLVEGQGNFGSIDGDPPAAMRYTEAKLSPLGEYLLADIRKNTVEFDATYDGEEQEPKVLPAGLPVLLMNGTEGIAVGMATRIPPHNLRELGAAVAAVVDNPDIAPEALLKHVQGPDFPGGGLILGRSGIEEAYKTGRGTITMRGRAEVEQDSKGRYRIVINEIPYQVNKAQMVEKIAELVRDKKIEHVRDIRDESDRNGIRVVIELMQQANAQVVINRLYKYSPLETSYSIIMLCIDDGVPRLLSLKEVLDRFINHRREVIRRRSEFELERAVERKHILEGLKVALDNLDEVIEIIRGSKNPSEAKAKLMEEFELSEIQSQAILDMRLAHLTSLEVEKVLAELAELLKLIEYLEDLLAHPKKIDGVLKKELAEAVEKFGDARRTIITSDSGEIDEEDLIKREAVVVTVSRDGYIKRVPLSTYRAQGRGGKGLIGATTKTGDVVNLLTTAETHDTLLCFTSRGIVHSLKVYRVPAFDRSARGIPVINLISIAQGETVTALVNLADYSHPYLFMCTKMGIAKKVEIDEFKNIRSTGKRAILLEDNDELLFVLPTTGQDQLAITSRAGMTVIFNEDEVRAMGTAAKGVIGIRLGAEDDWVVGCDKLSDEDFLLVASEHGYGKRSKVELFRKTHRGAKGVISLKVTDKTGPVIAARRTDDGDDILIITERGQMIRQQVSKINVYGRSAQGVRLITLSEGDKVSDVAVVSQTGDELPMENGNGE
ncbi:MAG: DNA gyrase subunit A [bacterium]|jgi:DNA gyrase subunit A